MLGSREFFRKKFVNPIDKNRDPHKAESLSRMLHPFMLPRTKVQIAPELPAKTETIFWCNLSKEQ
jgi:SNF2 family DNA or RNA helicase